MREGMMLSDVTIGRTGLRLLSMLFAEYEWMPLRRDGGHDLIDEFAAESLDRISEDLVSLAAMARAADDELATLKALEKVFPQGVGTLAAKGGVVPLMPREACNKVLHAKKFYPRLDMSSENPLYWAYYKANGIDRTGAFKDPYLVLEGERHGAAWTAEVRAIPFVMATSGPGVWQWKFS